MFWKAVPQLRERLPSVANDHIELKLRNKLLVDLKLYLPVLLAEIRSLTDTDTNNSNVCKWKRCRIK